MAIINRRIGLLFGGFVLLLVIALGRATYLGLFRAGALQQAAALQQVSRQTIPAARGTITDRNGVVLALSEAADEVIADPFLIRAGHPIQTARQLAPLLHMPEATVLARLTKAGTGYSVLAPEVPAAAGTEIMNLRINGISEQPTEKRVYPRDDVAAQVLGWVGASGTGLGGLEYLYNHQLQGTNGVRRVVSDALGQPISETQLKPTRPGQTLALTISAPLQQEVEQVLAGVGAAYQPKAATAIVMNPNNGQILALANWPRFNANHVTQASLANTEDMAVGFSYEPGSTFKAVTVGGALQDGLVTPSTPIGVPSQLNVDGYTITDAEVHPNETLSVAQILKVSSNIGADEIAQRLGPQKFDYWVHRFGFGKLTGVDLPGEQVGVVKHWWQYSPVSMFNLPFGQGESVTPIQMATAYSAVANGGILRAPEIVQSIGGVPTRPAAGTRILSPTVAYELRNMLRGVLGEGGTASGAAITGYDLAGKTGTAQVVINGKYSNTLFDSSFIGMVPASHPKLVVEVVVDQTSQYGGSIAAPAFQKIVGWAVPYFGINPCPSPCPASAMNPAPTATG
ncbi:MAG TPA: penicillin-binding protein 2 [Solirubrobacteraceae bacterium]|nr:penicillin-binding protein 2 [Solirubrobacteraceae bacterium]